jgi:hypothetical protein
MNPGDNRQPGLVSDTQAKWTNDLFLFDNLKFVSIYSICFFHGITLISNSVIMFACRSLIPFAIPIFAFASGYSQKNLKSTSYFRKTLCVYFAANLLYAPSHFLYIIRIKQVPCPWLLVTGLTAGYLWYFLALIAWKMITPFVIQLRHPLLSSTLFTIALYAVSELLIDPHESYEGNTLIMSLRQLIRSYPFFLLGVISTREHIIKLRRSQFKWLLLIPAGIGMYLCGSGIIENEPATDSAAQCLGFLAIAMICSVALFSMIPGGSYKHITPLGQKTLGIYIFHIFVLRAILKPFGLPAIASLAPLWNSIFQIFFYIAVVYAVCRVSAIDLLMTYFNKLSAKFESLLFNNLASINR